MAVLTQTVLKGPYPSTLTTGGTTITWADRDAAGDEFTFSGHEILLAWNNGATGTATVTVSSVADANNRTGDISMEDIATGAMVAFGPFTKAQGWVQADGNINVAVTGTGAADVDFAVLVMP